MKSTGKLFWVLITLFLVWTAAVLASYYLVQNAFFQPILEKILAPANLVNLKVSGSALAEVALDLLVVTWITACTVGVGRLLFLTILPENTDTLVQTVYSAGLGYGLIGLVILAMGLMGLLEMWILLMLMGIFTVIAVPQLISLLREISVQHRPGRLVTIYFLMVLAMVLTSAALPPTSWDALFYHLTGPKLYLDAGQIISGIDIPHLNFPSMAEMWFLLGMGIRGDGTSALLHFQFLLFLAGIIFLIARDQLKLKNGWLALLILFSVQLIIVLATWAYNDLALAFYELAALYALLSWKAQRHQNPQKSRRWLYISAIFIGLSMGLKYTAVVAAISLVLLLAWLNQTNLRSLLRLAVIYVAIASALVLPWLAKNALFTGNPVYPFVFKGQNWDSFRANAYGETGTGIAYDPSTCDGDPDGAIIGQHSRGCDFDAAYFAKGLVTLPYQMMLGLKDASRDGFIGPLLLVFLPLVLHRAIVDRKDQSSLAVFALLFFVGLQYLFWVTGVALSASLWQSRLLLPALVALCPLSAWALDGLSRYDRKSFSLQRLLYLSIYLVLIVGLLLQFSGWLFEQPWAYISGSESRDAYLSRQLGEHYSALQFVNSEAGNGSGGLDDRARVLFLWEPRSYYCKVECLPDSILDAYGHYEYRFGTAERIIEAWKQEGITHILLFRAGLDFILDISAGGDQKLGMPPELQRVLEIGLEPIRGYDGKGYEIYRLR